MNDPLNKSTASNEVIKKLFVLLVCVHRGDIVTEKKGDEFFCQVFCSLLLSIFRIDVSMLGSVDIFQGKGFLAFSFLPQTL